MTEEKPLHVRVAEALGCKPELCSHDWGPHWRCGCDPWGEKHGYPESQRCQGEVLSYDSDWSAAGPLIEKYGIHVSRWNRYTGSRAWWFAGVVGFNPQEEHEETVVESRGCDSPLEAVCHLILALSKAGKLPK